MPTGAYYPLLPQVTAVLPATGWTVRSDRFWCYVLPDGQELPRQGWKLHVSATPTSGLLVLARVARVLVERGCAFKFAADLDRLGDLLRPKADRSSAGKFITVYPSAGTDVAALAGLLDHVTAGLPGPHVLSDRRYRPDSLVHLRYGVIAAPPVLADDGILHHRLRHPDGTLVDDHREAWFTVPEWADDPMPPEPEQPPADLRLAGRYRVTEAITHANKGGVFRAVDEAAGGVPVIVKQARAHVGATLTGRDAQSLLRAEAVALRALGPLGLTPRYVDEFTLHDSLFLVQEQLDGVPLVDWTADRLPAGMPLRETRPAEVLPLAARVVALVGAVHAAGFRLGDITPGNLIVAADGTVRAIDLETAGTAETPLAPVGTPGYFPPEYDTGLVAPDAGFAADRYALGAVLFHLATGIDPIVLASDPPSSRADRLAHWWPLIVDGDDPAAAALRRVATGLMDLDPADRPSVSWAAAELTTPAPPPMPAPRSASAPAPDGLLGDLVAYLGEAALAAPSGPPDTDPRAVHAGAAGILGVLTRIDPHSDAVAALMRVAGGPAPDGAVLPGLFSGVAGVAWAGAGAGAV